MMIIPQNDKALYEYIGDKKFIHGKYEKGKIYSVCHDDSLIDGQIYLLDDDGKMNWEFAWNFKPLFERKVYRIIYRCRDFEEDNYIEYPVDVIIYKDDDIDRVAESIKENLQQKDIIIKSMIERELLND